ncbi:MAG TPA: YbhB/YbcL family Raf kinase inhibitor-like protein [Candidatus Eremiobacteraceae bacterium]|nr:YbhB/YbcL family Raf kinase inhibitor-like protein [Candidatus Eremiobacteraceae bacterium]
MIGYVVAALAFTLASNTFSGGGTLPKRAEYNQSGCSGHNIPPELHWSGAPAGTKSYALTMHDPDAQAPGGWWHWVVFNIPAEDTSLNTNPRGMVIPWVYGTTSFMTRAYGGPCPPPGKPHHYDFTLYALDVPTVSGATGATTGPELVKLIEGHVLGKTTLTGMYGR